MRGARLTEELPHLANGGAYPHGKIRTTLLTSVLPSRADTIQVLHHGSSYTKAYWDIKFGGVPQLSYMQLATSMGFKTLACDQLGASSV
jgi:hypothetical protein